MIQRVTDRAVLGAFAVLFHFAVSVLKQLRRA
jgi:hypothetical protein